MRTLIWFGLLIGAPAFAVDLSCNDVLSGFSAEIQASIHDLAKLRFDLDQRLARGENDLITRSMQVEYANKETEILKRIQLDRETFIAKLKLEIESIQTQIKIEESSQAKTKASEGEEARDAETSVKPLGELIEGRSLHAESVLSDGRVLISGGYDGEALKSIELIDPASGKSEIIASLNDARYQHLQVVLPDGHVFVMGGFNGYDPVDSIELIDPVKKTVEKIEGIEAARSLVGQKVSLMPNGQVIVTGGSGAGRLVSVALVDPVHLTEVSVGNLNYERLHHSQTALPDGRVLIAGGRDAFNFEILNLIEMYDPSEKLIQIFGRLNEARMNHAESLLPDDKIVISGGEDKKHKLSSIELIDPDKNTVEKIGDLEDKRTMHQQLVLPDGRILVVGGLGEKGEKVTSIELIDPYAKTVEKVGNLPKAKTSFTLTLLSDDRILLIGGIGGSNNQIRFKAIDVIKVGRN